MSKRASTAHNSVSSGLCVQIKSIEGLFLFYVNVCAATSVFVQITVETKSFNSVQGPESMSIAPYSS